MKEVIKNIIKGDQISEIFDYVISNLYKKGPVDGTDMEILSYLALYRPNEFEIYKDKILNYMGVFYKDVKRSSLNEIIFGQYKKYIRDTYNEYYTPVQADIVKNISKAALPNKIKPIIALIIVANITAPADISFAIPTIRLYLLW